MRSHKFGFLRIYRSTQSFGCTQNHSMIQSKEITPSFSSRLSTMGTAQSSHAKNQIAPVKEQLLFEVSGNQSVMGRKSALKSIDFDDAIKPALDAEEEDDLASFSESDEDLDAGLEERREILNDARLLKQFATFHLHPEAPVVSNGYCGRNYFERPSALGQLSFDKFEEKYHIFEETIKGDDDGEGHLSRSPSSIMLFGFDMGTQAH